MIRSCKTAKQINEQKWRRMRLILDKLEEKPMSTSEIEQLFSKSAGDKIVKRSVQNYMAELIALGLVFYNSEDGIYELLENKKVFQNRHNYEIALKHSEKLLPALKNILNIMTVERHVLHPYVKQHLKSYPNIYQKLEKLEAAFDERIRYLLSKHGSRVKGPNEFLILDPVKVKRRGFLGRFFYETKFKRRNVPYMIDLSHPGMAYEDFVKSESYREIVELKKFLDDGEKVAEMFEVYGELAADLAVLALKVEMGQPLEGKCALCPKVKILKDKTD